MKTNIELLNKRRELKEYIDSNIENTPMGLFFRFPNILLKRYFGYSSKLSKISNAFILGFLVPIPTLFAVLIFSEVELLKPVEWLGVFIVLEGFCVSVLTAYFNVNRLLRKVRNLVVDSMMSISDLSDLKQWLSLGWTPRFLRLYLLCWIVSLIPVGILNLYFVLGKSQSVGLFVWLVTFLVLSGVSWSYAPLNMVLSVRLSRYEYSLHEMDPARSEVLNRVYSSLNSYAYGYAINAALVQLIFSAVGLSSTHFLYQ